MTASDMNLSQFYQDCFSIQFLLMCSYKKLPVDMKKGMQILCADGSIVLEVISTNPEAGTVRAKCMNNATLGYETLCQKDINQLLNTDHPWQRQKYIISMRN